MEGTDKITSQVIVCGRTLPATARHSHARQRAIAHCKKGKRGYLAVHTPGTKSLIVADLPISVMAGCY